MITIGSWRDLRWFTSVDLTFDRLFKSESHEGAWPSMTTKKVAHFVEKKKDTANRSHRM